MADRHIDVTLTADTRKFTAALTAASDSAQALAITLAVNAACREVIDRFRLYRRLGCPPPYASAALTLELAAVREVRGVQS